MPTPKTESLAKFALQVAYSAPIRCCPSWEDCLKTPPDSNGRWCQTTGAAAGGDAAFVRLALNRERNQSNPTGGGPKKAWYPSKDGWYPLATVGEDLLTAGLEPGVYCVQYADAEEQPTEEIRLTLRAEPDGGPAAAARPAEPRPTQTQLDDLHRVGLEDRKLAALAAETNNQATRELLKAAGDAIRQCVDLQKTNAETVRVMQDVCLGQAESSGKIIQFTQQAIERGTALALMAQGPPSAQVVNALGAQLRATIQEVTALLLVRQGKLGAVGPSPAIGEDPVSEAARLRAENEALKQVQALREENARLKKQAEATPARDPEPAAGERVIDAEVQP